jgi:putative tryptophan/tyrosine transport system substrate-binding protein
MVGQEKTQQQIGWHRPSVISEVMRAERGDPMRRRDFIALLGGAAAAWPLGARAQTPATPTIGFLHSGSEDHFTVHRAAFRDGLQEAGYVEGRNVAVDYRWADGAEDKLAALAAVLVKRGVAVIAAVGGSISAHEAKLATATIPILFITGTDPRFDGLVESFYRPGGNATGVYLYTNVVIEKCIEQLRDLVPHASTVAILRRTLGPSSSAAERQERTESDHRLVMRSDIHAVIVSVSGEGDFESAFAAAAQQRAGALIVDNEALFNNRRAELVARAASHGLPTAYMGREYVVAGGLMSYAQVIPQAYRQIGKYAGQILKGQNPAELPVYQPSKFELVINRKTAAKLGLTVPPSLLAIADEIID